MIKNMYYPIQIPYVLDKEFAESIKYSEEIVPNFKDFVICFWKMQPLSNAEKTVETIIIADGCIDLVVDYDGKTIGFAGMSKTDFNFKISLPANSMGVRLKPGAFYAITNIPANKAMDSFIPIETIDRHFDTKEFFSLDLSNAKIFFKNYIGSLIENKKPSKFMVLFEELNNGIPNSALEVYKKLYYSHRQCQRLFLKNYGLSPQMVLCILRFQWCLKKLTSGEKSPKGIMDISNYYDQSHFIHDFKQNIGLTPLELVRKYTS
jgi:AraC-like DNA-binding protein